MKIEEKNLEVIMDKISLNFKARDERYKLGV